MRKILFSILLLCGSVTSVFCLPNMENLDSLYIKEQHCSNGNCFHLLAHEKTIGMLRPKLKTSSIFEFFDEQDQRQITVRFTGTSLSRKSFMTQYMFDIYDKNKILVAKLLMSCDWPIVSFLKFKLYSPDRRTILASGGTDWLSYETKQYVYLADSEYLIASFSRPLWTLSRDSNVTLIDKQEFFATQNPHLLTAVLMLYCMHDIQMNAIRPENMSLEVFQALQSNLQQVAQDTDHTGVVLTQEQIKAAAELLHQRFQEKYDENSLSEEDKIKTLLYFGCDLIRTHTLSASEEQAMLQVLADKLMSQVGI